MQFQESNNFEIQTLRLKPDSYYKENLYPFCIVWTILPCITWFIPVIGHTGACDSKGVIYDFLGMHINKRNMAFCSPRKYVKINLSQIRINKSNDEKQHSVELDETQFYDNCLKQTNQEFSREGHNICCNNCHHHVARFLNLLQYRGRTDWTQVSIWWLFLREGSYVAWWAPLQVYGVFLLALLLFAGIWAISQFTVDE